MHLKFRRLEKFLIVSPLLVLAPYLYMMLVGRHVFRHPLFLLGVAFSRDSKFLVTGCGDNVTRIWNVENGTVEEALPGAIDGVMAVAISRDTRLVASITDTEGLAAPSIHHGELRVWKRGTSKPLWIMPVNASTSGEGAYLSFAPDGRTLACAVKGISIWDMQTGHLKCRFGPANYGLWSLVYSPDGRTIASGDYEGKVKLWNPQNGALRKTLIYSDSRH